jgi:hypothetical protein
MEDVRLWILYSIVGLLWLVVTWLVGIFYRLGRSFVNKILEKFDILIKEIQDLKTKDVALTKDIEKIKETQEEHSKEIKKINIKIQKHYTCKNYEV